MTQDGSSEVGVAVAESDSGVVVLCAFGTSRKWPMTRPPERAGTKPLDAQDAIRHNAESGRVTVHGTDSADKITVVDRKGKLHVHLISDGEVQKATFDSAEVADILFAGWGGDDGFANKTDVPSIAYGHAGNDKLIGGAAADQLFGGEVDDVLRGGDSDDVLDGDEGADRLSGGRGFTTQRGGTVPFENSRMA